MDFMPLPRGRLWTSKADFFRPFRTAAAVEAENTASIFYDPSAAAPFEEDEPNVKDLNAALGVLLEVFPDVEPDLLRQMLTKVSEESRVELIADQLWKKETLHVRSRRRTARPDPPPTTGNLVANTGSHGVGLPLEHKFRTDSYKTAVKQVFYQEFKSLNHSTIKAVLAEQNYSYTLCRPILQEMSAKSWRWNIWSKRSVSGELSGHPFIFERNQGEAGQSLGIKRTGNAQLDRELYDLLVAPELEKRQLAQLEQDHIIATVLNQNEAEAAQALCDCECCYNSVAFEQLAICDEGCHQLCFDCVRRSVNEALFGQGFARTVDMERVTVRCFAPTAQECSGSLAPETVRRALTSSTGDEATWSKFSIRVANETLDQSGVKLHRCPQCEYAEVDETPPFKLRSWQQICHHVAVRSPPALHIMILSLLAGLAIFTIPLLLILLTLWFLATIYPPMGVTFTASYIRVHKSRRGLKFHCRHPSCLTTTCNRCLAIWRDPHVCFESATTSLRTALETSATTAIKRTCPKCLLSFVKSSGCNKLVCRCGYTMCYICRQEITTKEGYGHFCQHFRPNGGRCVECERCDLYGDEDEEAVVRRAVEKAEEEWRQEQEGGGEGGEREKRERKLMMEAVVGGRSRKGRWWGGLLDTVIDAIAA